MKRYLLLLFTLFMFLFPVQAQNRFITLDWQELPAAHTLPIVVEHIPLSDDFGNYTYKVNIEFPEFETLPPESVAVLAANQVTLPAFPQAESTVEVSAHKGILNVRFVPVVYRNGKYQRINSFKLSVERAFVATRVAPVTRTTENSVLSSGKFVKIRVADSGVYRVTHTELKRMGFSDPGKVKLYGYGGHLLSRIFSELPADDLPEVPLYRGGDAILFYARGSVSWKLSGNYFIRERNFYSDYGYYFLTESETAPAEFSVEETAVSGVNRIETFNAHALYEKDAYTWGQTGRELYDSHDYSVNNSQNYSFKLPGITNDLGYLTVVFAARSVGGKSSSDAATILHTSIDGVKIGTQSIGGIASANSYYTKAVETTFNHPWEGSKSESTTVTLTHALPTGASGRLNYIVLNFQQSLRMNGSSLPFRSLASIGKESTFVISGANSSTIVWDVTSPDTYKQMKGVLNGDTYTFTIPASQNLREFVAVNTSGTFSGVENMGEIPNQNLHALKGIDMVIICPDKTGLLNEAERLAQAHRDYDGLSVQVVTAPQVYNEFSSGTPDATAYRRLMKMLYDRSSLADADHPKYLLLFGDCSYDNRMITPAWSKQKTSDYLLCYQSENSVQETTSYVTDDYFGFLDDKEGSTLSSARLDIGIGRFPVTTAEDARAVVDKTIAYMENKEAGPWKRTLCYVADDGDSNTHMSQANELTKKVQREYPEFHIERIFADAFRLEASATGATYPQANSRLLKLFEQGMLIVNYTGHGSTTAWSAESLLTVDQITKLSSPRLPLWITATCDFTRFDDLATSAGEYAFLNPDGGAIALFSTSRVVYSYQNSTLNTAFAKYLFARPDGQRLALGDIMRLAKCDSNLDGDGNKLNFTLIGDPALKLAYPDYKIEVDEFGGPLTEDWPYVKAGGKVTVKGRVLTPEGTPADDFTGTVHPMVFDNEETVSTLNNTGEGVFTYTERSKVLFSGTDSVRNGHFEFTFPVPLDINYSDAQGLLNLYACNTDKQEAGGAFDRFLVGGTADDLDMSDTNGPQVSIYLNTPDFQWGGQVNETPWFVAEVKDEDGINTVGNGIGHDLSLCIDGKTTYSLNDYYTPLAGSYTEGKVAFSVPALSAGKHSLTFRAWDIKNNSTVKQLDFEVINGLRPGLFSVSCTKSPAREETTFVLSHDRPGSQLDVRIAVCDFAGRELWVHIEQGVSSEKYYYIDWDLCSNLGQRLSPGVYLYRASVTSGGSKESTKTGKIVILAQ